MIIEIENFTQIGLIGLIIRYRSRFIRLSDVLCGLIGIFGAPFNGWGSRLALGLKTFKHLMTKINMIQLVKQQEALWTFIKIPFKARKFTPSRIEILRWNKNNKKYFASLEEKLPWHLKSRLVCFPSKH